jgi:hypothetical protein
VQPAAALRVDHRLLKRVVALGNGHEVHLVRILFEERLHLFDQLRHFGREIVHLGRIGDGVVELPGAGAFWVGVLGELEAALENGAGAGELVAYRMILGAYGVDLTPQDRKSCLFRSGA